MHNSKISGRLWFNLILFGLVGQLAWNVENMYFNTFLYNKIYSGGVSQAAIDGTMPVMSAISIMVGLSAATAVITTFVMGTLSDRLHRRKPESRSRRTYAAVCNVRRVVRQRRRPCDNLITVAPEFHDERCGRRIRQSRERSKETFATLVGVDNACFNPRANQTRIIVDV